MSLYHLFIKCYQPSASRVKELTEKLEKLDMRTYPGENVSTFVVEATAIIKEIKMNYLMPNQVPDLTMAALSGLTTCSDTHIRNKARDQRFDANGLSFALTTPVKKVDPIDLLNSFEQIYCRMIEAKDYTPALAKILTNPKGNLGDMCLPCNQAQVKGQLVQDRNATSTHGNSTGGNAGSKKIV